MSQIKIFASGVGLLFLFLLFASVSFILQFGDWRGAAVIASIVATPLCLYQWHQGEQKSCLHWLVIAAILVALTAFFLVIDCFVTPFLRSAPSVCKGGPGIPLFTLIIGTMTAIAISSALRAFMIEKWGSAKQKESSL